MKDYLYLMHHDGGNTRPSEWDAYVGHLRKTGRFDGGSAIGGGECVNKSGGTHTINTHLSGYLRLQAKDLSEAKALLAGNPVFEAGGTVEIRELPRG